MRNATLYLIVLLITPVFTAAGEVQRLSSDATRALNLPISDATRVGNLLFISGQLGNLPGKPVLAEGGIEAETRQVFKNISAALTRAGSSMDKLAKCTVYMVDPADREGFEKAWRESLEPHFPTRTTITVRQLALNARVEIECIAAAQ